MPGDQLFRLHVIELAVKRNDQAQVLFRVVFPSYRDERPLLCEVVEKTADDQGLRTVSPSER